jgi:hypothetical protein
LRFISFVFLLKVMLLLSLVGAAQEYNYKHYDSRDGLSNSSIYHMLRDRDGFIWFATQSGLSRFDGTSFTNFSTLDGLPGNLIVRMFQDSQGRIWLMPFRNEICFYYKGKIHNQQNDSLLKQIKLEDFARDVVENKRKELLLTDAKNIYHIDAQNNVRLIGQELAGMGFVNQVIVSDSGEFNVRSAYKLYSTDGKKFSYIRDIPSPKTTMEQLIVRDRVTCWMDMNTLCVESPYYGKSYRKFI